MKVIGNIFWAILAGIWLFIIYSIIGLVMCITIIGIPYGVQCFKIAKFIVAPFGKKIDTHFGKHPIANVLWIIIVGWESAIWTVVLGTILCITVIGIPIGLKYFQIAKILFIPFGSEIIN